VSVTEGLTISGLVGLFLGIRSSTPEETIEIKSDDDYNKLKKYINYNSTVYKDYK